MTTRRSGLTLLRRYRRLVASLSVAWMAASCGGSVGPEAPASDAVRVRAQAVASTSLAIELPQAADPMMAGLTIPADAPAKGMWSATQNWPLNGLHSILLPNGRILTFGTPTGQPATQDGRYFDVWNPTQGFADASHTTSYSATQVNSFCGAATFLTDGRLLVSSGNTPLDSTEFTPATAGIATAAAKLADERWYATMLTLPDGRALIMGGSVPYEALQSFANPTAAINGGTVSMTPEVYDPAVGWTSLFGASSREAFGPDFNRWWYPRAWIAPNGQVFGISSEKMWYLDPAGNGSVRVVGDFKTGANNTTRPNIGPTSTAVMFAPGRILQVGGNGYHDGYASPGSALATVIDINGGDPVLTETAPMNFPRHWANSVVLPDGRVVVTGGTRYANNGGADAVYEAELWDPTTGTWTIGAAAAQIRVYHSATILMPNGTVLSTGGGAPGPVNNLNAEVYYPPYLFRTVAGQAQLAPRPAMIGINALQFVPGATIEVDMADSAAVSRLVLIGTSSVTHSFNTTQRYQTLAFAQSGNRITAALPANAADVPPGYYQLIALDAAGVPSVGVIIGIGQGVAKPPVSTLPRNELIQLQSIGSPDRWLATDDSGLGIFKQLGADSAPADLAAQFILRDGLADSRCVSLESAVWPGKWLRHYGFRLQLGTNNNTDLFRNDATFCPETGLSGSGQSFRSTNYPAYVLHVRNLQAWIDPVTNDASFAAEASFNVVRVPLPEVEPIAAPPVTSGATATYTATVAAPGVQYRWDFGDGTTTAFSTSNTVTHTYANPGTYLVSLTVRLPDGRTTTTTFVQAVNETTSAGTPQASSALLLEPRASGAARLWVVNGDNDSVSVFDTATYARLAEIAVGRAPRALALAADGRIWATNKGAATISVIDPGTLTVARTIALPRASQPFGVVFAGNAAFVALEATGTVLKLDGNGAQLASLAVGAHPRHLSATGDGKRLLVSRFITPPLPGESTAAPQTTADGAARGGEVLVVDTETPSIAKTIVLQHSDKTDNEVQGRGVPNYLGAAAISPDGRSAWVPSKQDNVKRGLLRDGMNLDFQNTVRAISSRIDLSTLAEDYAGRVDHDNAGVAGSAAFHPTGVYLFVALETSRQIAVLDAVGKREFFRIEAGRAPQAVAVSADGLRLYVHNFMDRTVGVYDLQPLVNYGEFNAPLVATLAAVGSEALAPDVLKGKQLFYDARDPRLARDAYLSCAACHNDGGHDGRTWDLTGMGEGLRNTIALRGRAATRHGFLHWTANFDELQDFEAQIRNLAGGTGLMSDTDYNAGTRSQPLGDAKAGLSADLDALAAYVASLDTFAPSPYRAADGALSAAALSGKTVFTNLNCASCHAGSAFTQSADASRLQDIGTIKATSGSRLGAALTALDVPTLRDAWATAPYLHDGSAATLEAAIQAHRGVNVGAAELANLTQYVREIGADEITTPVNASGRILRETWTGIGGSTLAALTGSARYPGLPDTRDYPTSFESVTNWANNYGTRMRGYVTAPVTGSYTFWIAGDDNSELLLSPDTSAANAAVIASVPGWTSPRQWTKYAQQKSASISLQAGQIYYIEARHKEGGGGDNLAVAWQIPGGSQAVIAGQYLMPYVLDEITGTQPLGSGLLGQYFGNTTLSATALVQRIETIDFVWGRAAPAPGVPADRFSVRWTGQLEAPTTGTYRLQTISDDGVRVWVNGALLINDWTSHAAKANTTPWIALSAGQRVTLRIEYYDGGSDASMRFLWQTPETSSFAPVPAGRLYAPN
jgi:YVTN family beta-propeller protein